MADNLRLADYRPKSQLRVPQHLVERPRFPVIDMHNHSQWDGTWQVTDVPALLAAMDAAGVVARVDLDGGMGARLGTHLRRFREPYPDRFAVFASVDWPPYLEHDDFGVRVAQDLRCLDAAWAGRPAGVGPALPLHVNVWPATLEHPGFWRWLAAVPPGSVVVEVLETHWRPTTAAA